MIANGCLATVAELQPAERTASTEDGRAATVRMSSVIEYAAKCTRHELNRLVFSLFLNFFRFWSDVGQEVQMAIATGSCATGPLVLASFRR